MYGSLDQSRGREMSEETPGDRDALGVAHLSDLRQRFEGLGKSAEYTAKMMARQGK
jgi:hypothetical protein